MIPVSALGSNARILIDGNLPVTPTAQNPAVIFYLSDVNGANSRPTLNNPPTDNLEPYIDLSLSKLEAYQKSVSGTSDETNMNMSIATRRPGTAIRSNLTVPNTNYRNTEQATAIFYYGNTSSNDPDQFNG